MHLSLLMLFCFLQTTALAQLNKGDWWLGGGISGIAGITNSIEIYPEIQYVLNPKWSIGSQLSFFNTNFTYAEVFARRHFNFKENWLFYGQAGIFGETKTVGASLNAGVMYQFHERWMVFAKSNILNLGYVDDNNWDGWFVNGRLSLMIPQIGFQFRLNA